MEVCPILEGRSKVREKEMGNGHASKVFLVFTCLFLVSLLFYASYCWVWKKLSCRKRKEGGLEDGLGVRCGVEEEKLEVEELIKFDGGENLTAHDILDAPGEVVAKSSYQTIYRACIRRSNSAVLLRFIRPDCAGRTEEVLTAARTLGSVRHPNLVPLRAIYVGPRGEKLFIHPFYAAGTFAHFLARVAEAHTWDIIYKLSCGVARGLDHLHNGHEKAIIHGNLKTNNILLDVDFQPRLSDYGLHTILNLTEAQEMLEALSAQGYKAPELIKMKDSSKESDIYSLGVILLEMLTQKDPPNNNFLQSKDIHLPTALRILVLEHKVSDVFSSNLLKKSIHQNSTNDEGIMMLFQIAIACCSTSPSMRPDIQEVIRRLESIAR